MSLQQAATHQYPNNVRVSVCRILESDSQLQLDETDLNLRYASTSLIASFTPCAPVGQRIFFIANCLYKASPSPITKRELANDMYSTVLILGKIHE